ncbi:murein L,D-transpeptidase [Kineosporia sp. J2-2]|uniref:Murein L,D-transpeptidase n=1 Tax=Kineosporia corallincola TaxID=2835133 RepID=A0ABS5TDD1_9ACTN|nr:L,D-transpeptidase family protein [Kineosporia corallincola]MBT0769092.1 murein L,D-transpeptidase [Kineosporia corallincola]
MRRTFTVPRTIPSLTASAVLGAALVVTGPAGAQAAALPAAPSATPHTASPVSAAPVAAASAARPTLRRGSSGQAVRTLQKRLNALGYWTGGAADGEFGGLTEQAVFALKKVAGLKRDGVVGPKVWRALDRGVRPKARSTTGHVIEIDKKRQVLKIVNDGRVTYTLNTSTGTGRSYVSQGSTHIASTPSGHFRVFRQIDGYRHAPLGVLYRPKYFNGGIAVHGSNSVPPYAASHGCARLSNTAINWIWNSNKMPIGTRVWVY